MKNILILLVMLASFTGAQAQAHYCLNSDEYMTELFGEHMEVVQERTNDDHKIIRRVYTDATVVCSFFYEESISDMVKSTIVVYNEDRDFVSRYKDIVREYVMIDKNNFVNLDNNIVYFVNIWVTEEGKSAITYKVLL